MSHEHSVILSVVYHPFARNSEKKSYTRDVQKRIESFQQRVLMLGGGRAAPVLYRSHLFTSISHESPSFLLDFIDMSANSTNGKNGFAQKRLHVTLYHLTYRYDIDSKWMKRLARLLPESDSNSTDQSSFPEPILQKPEHSMTKVSFFLSGYSIDVLNGSNCCVFSRCSSRWQISI